MSRAVSNMSAAFTAALLAIPAMAELTVLELPHGEGELHAFFAQLDSAGPGALIVLNGHTVTAYPGATAPPRWTRELPAGTSAVDVADLGDGRGVLIAVHGNRVMRYSPPAVEGELLFELHTLLGAPAPAPYPYPIAVPWQGATALALPRRESLEIRSPSGELLESIALELDHQHAMAMGEPFAAAAIQPPQTAPLGALEWRIRNVFDPSLPGNADGADGFPWVSQRVGRAAQAREASALGPQHWPWFYLRQDDPAGPRVYYALAEPDFRDTLVSIRRMTPGATGEGYLPGPERRYPGILVTPQGGLPDFDGDGHIDLLLWKSPTPGTTFGALARAAQSRTWPVTFTTHLHAPERRLYEAKPSGRIDLRVPTLWFLSLEDSAPVKNLVTRDLNGSGRTDLAFSPAPNEFTIYYENNGFRRRPDEVVRFDAPVTGIEQAAALGSGVTAILLRTETSLAVLRLE